jgi:type IV pilus assembly protein PilX
MSAEPSFKRVVRAQRGVSLIFAMLALATVSLAAAGLVRTTNADALITGNLSFKAETAAFAERGTEAAIAWIEARDKAALYADSGSAGYYANHRNDLDITGQDATRATRALIDWDDDGCAKAPNFSSGACIAPTGEYKPTGSSVGYRYVITRLCTTVGDLDPPNSCVTGIENQSLGDSSRDRYDYQRNTTPPSVVVQQPSYRVVVRATGPRNAVTFTETIIRK